MKPKRINLSGQRFGRWLVTDESFTVKGHIVYWVCVCDCGTQKPVRANALRNGSSVSCGCYNIDSRITHGHSKTKKCPHGTSAYRAWETMKGRCYRPQNASYKTHGGRGIIVCDRWLVAFENFLEDMGEPPPGQQLDRIDNNGNYEPSNCRWVTAKINGRNRNNNVNVCFNNKTQCLSAWAEEYNINYSTFFNRLSMGWPFERALLTPVFFRGRRDN